MTDPVPSRLAAAISETRQWDRLMQMARIGGFSGPEGEGVNRAALSPLDAEARRLLIRWGRELGMSVSVDPIGNLFLRCEGTEPGAAPVMAGSHMDSQPNGGRFDGIWGVVAALEAVQAIRDSGTAIRRPIEVVAWTNEEGSRFAPGCMGSMAWSGHAPADSWDLSRDVEGVTFREALETLLASESDLPHRPLGPSEGHRPHAYVEAHIEQGPRLEAEGLDIGIVTGIQGSRWFTVELVGETAHAGTAPLKLRKDAVQDMVRAITALDALMTDPEDILRFTVGRIEVFPNSTNTVADRVRFSIDFRHPDKDVLLLNGDAIESTIRTAVKACQVTVAETFHSLPTEFDGSVQDALEDAALAQGLRTIRLPSGALHDAKFLVPVCPTGMLFVPSRKGISHNPAEYTSPQQLAAGTRVLAEALARLANG
ncbi:Zn-dependent hydrolase [Roseomonas sp. OT10]|uniref:Zn-dependent hydrolase n=1 Tax=Roseomonas cutis TaxID=2897332 RepID=UPI001E398CCB|nr:Zn-dependent hydrolase [Roseomonas sp. OT10]UFN47074.1 Zn-dependent hydrolase [Roseomonas sp. OT10]